MKAEKTEADRRRREEKADEVVELVLDALKALLDGSGAIVVSEGHDAGSKIISFQMPAKKEETLA